MHTVTVAQFHVDRFKVGIIVDKRQESSCTLFFPKTSLLLYKLMKVDSVQQ